MAERILKILYGGALFTLPWCGVGTLKLVTGRDWGFGLQPSWFLLAGACLVWLVWLRRSSHPEDRPFVRPVVVSLLLTLAAVLVSVAGLLLAPSGETAATAVGRFFRQFVQLGIMLVFTLWAALWTCGQERWRFTLRWLAFGALFQVGYGLLQYWHFYHPGPLVAWLEEGFTSNPAILSGSQQLYLGDAFRNVPRLRGTMCEPLYLGNLLLLALPWTWWARRWWPWMRQASGLLLLLLLLTWSRGAWLGFIFQGLGLACLTVLHRRGQGRPGLILPQRPVLRWGGLALGLLLVAAFLLADWQVFRFPRERFIQVFSTTDWSNLTRVYSMQAAWRAFLLSPYVGVGWGQYSFHFPALVDPLGLQSQFTWPVVNNFLLKVLCETGVLGLAVFLAVAWYWLREAVTSAVAWGAERPVLPALVAVAGVWVQTLTFSQYNLPHIWIGLGLLLASLRPTSRRKGRA